MGSGGAVKIIIGLILIIAGIYSYITWQPLREQLIALVKLVVWNIPGLVILIGIIVLLLGLSDAKG